MAADYSTPPTDDVPDNSTDSGNSIFDSLVKGFGVYSSWQAQQTAADTAKTNAVNNVKVATINAGNTKTMVIAGVAAVALIVFGLILSRRKS